MGEFSQIRDFTRRHGELRPRLTLEDYRDLASSVDIEEYVIPEALDSTRSYLDLLIKGPRVVPLLMEDLGNEASWWKIHMVSFFAREVFRLPIELPEALSEHIDIANEKVREWWAEVGQAYYESIEPELASREIGSLDW